MFPGLYLWQDWLTFALTKMKRSKDISRGPHRAGRTKTKKTMTRTNMKERENLMRELQYRINRYQAMGNGAACQDLMMQLRQKQMVGSN